MGLRRCESTCSCLGRLARLQNRAPRAWRRRSWIPRESFSQAAPEFHLVGEPQGPGRRKFFEHFVYIARAMNDFGTGGQSLWDDVDGFYYDVLKLPNGEEHFLKIRSMVGLIPLFAVETLEPEIVDCLPGFKRRMQWFIDNHPDVPEHIEMTQRSA